jgi:class 3 adenylate cyclase/CHASE2 domain-containing sensor protein
MNKFTSTWAVVVSVVILLGLKLYNPLPLQTLELKTFDLYQKFGNNYESKSLVLLDISDEALTKEGQWPWKRDKLGRAIVNAYRNGAALVFLNVVFVHKDRLGGDEKFLKMISKYPIILTETSQAKNLISIKRKALAVGDVEVPIDVDGTIRKLPLDNSVPSVILNVIKFPIPDQKDIWIDFRHKITRINYADKDWSSMKGKIVFIGATFQGSTFVLTPNGLKNTHEIMALSTETLLSGKFITRPEWAIYTEFAVMIIGMGLFLFFIPRLGLVMSLVPFILYNTFIILSSFYLFNTYLCLTNWSYPVIMGAIIFLHLIYNNFARENRLKLQIKKQFEHYLSPDMVKKLQDDPSLLKLGGETRELTFLFCDIRGFTPISEKYKSDPQGLTKLINSFLTPMTDIILKSGGTIDKYMGDCIMAFWNAPLDCADHQKKAILVAKTMRERMKKLDLGFNIGIGINSGTAVVGNMGSDQRFDYSVLGDAVNLASRLEGQSKEFNTTIVIGEDTYKNAEELHKRMYKLGSVTVKGKTNKVKIYSIK